MVSGVWTSRTCARRLAPLFMMLARSDGGAGEKVQGGVNRASSGLWTSTRSVDCWVGGSNWHAIQCLETISLRSTSWREQQQAQASCGRRETEKPLRPNPAADPATTRTRTLTPRRKKKAIHTLDGLVGNFASHCARTSAAAAARDTRVSRVGLGRRACGWCGRGRESSSRWWWSEVVYQER